MNEVESEAVSRKGVGFLRASAQGVGSEAEVVRKVIVIIATEMVEKREEVAVLFRPSLGCYRSFGG